VERREATWRESLGRQSPHLLVARSGDKVVGFVSFGASRDEGAQQDCAEVWAFYVSPAVWFRGVGKMLWSQASRGMIADGFRRASLWVIAGNERAIRFYRGVGFEPEPDSLKEFTLGGVTLEEVRYAIGLSGEPAHKAG